MWFGTWYHCCCLGTVIVVYIIVVDCMYIVHCCCSLGTVWKLGTWRVRDSHDDCCSPVLGLEGEAKNLFPAFSCLLRLLLPFAPLVAFCETSREILSWAYFCSRLTGETWCKGFSGIIILQGKQCWLMMYAIPWLLSTDWSLHSWVDPLNTYQQWRRQDLTSGEGRAGCEIWAAFHSQ